MSDFRAAFGHAIRIHRLKKGLSQESLADTAGIHRTYISDVELGKVNVGLEVAAKIAHALNIPLSTLISTAESHMKHDTAGD